jgi:hypothetical protein
MPAHIKPTPRAERVQVGDSCESIFGSGMPGVVLRIISRTTIDEAVVKWASGSIGHHTITTLRKVEPRG